jgi:hypothetical protein
MAAIEQIEGVEWNAQNGKDGAGMRGAGWEGSHGISRNVMDCCDFMGGAGTKAQHGSHPNGVPGPEGRDDRGRDQGKLCPRRDETGGRWKRWDGRDGNGLGSQNQRRIGILCP